MSRSIHTTREKYREAARFDYSNDDTRVNALGKIIDEIYLKRALKENAIRRKQSTEAGLREVALLRPLKAFASKTMIASGFSMGIAADNDKHSSYEKPRPQSEIPNPKSA
jgi:hypothetical protein